MVETCAGIIWSEILVRTYAVVERLSTMCVTVLIETIGEVACDGELFDRSDVETEGIREIRLTLLVAVRAFS